MSEENQSNNERLAILCGWVHVEEGHHIIGSGIGYFKQEGWEHPQSRVHHKTPPNFYANTPYSAYWREKAEAAFLNKFPGRGSRAAEIQTWAWGYDEFRAMIGLEHEPCDGDSKEIVTPCSYGNPGIARMDAIIAALEELDKERRL